LRPERTCVRWFKRFMNRPERLCSWTDPVDAGG
jgi:hypothetical protein